VTRQAEAEGPFGAAARGGGEWGGGGGLGLAVPGGLIQPPSI
jgi:hypothetical protein